MRNALAISGITKTYQDFIFLVGMITALIPCIVLACFGADVTLYSLALYGSIGISACLLAGGISLTCAYLFDPEKSQIVFMMSFMAATGIITGFVLLINLVFPVKDNILLAFQIVIIISAICFLSHTGLR